jgi:hypothetical protein
MVKQIARAIEIEVAIYKPRVALLNQPDAGLLSVAEMGRRGSWHVIQSLVTPQTAIAGGPVNSDEIANVPNAEHSSPQPAAPADQPGRPALAQSLSDARTIRRTRWREAVSIAVELVGIGVLAAGFWLVRPWAGLIVAGAGLIVLGFASSPRFDRRDGPR